MIMILLCYDVAPKFIILIRFGTNLIASATPLVITGLKPGSPAQGLSNSTYFFIGANMRARAGAE